MLGTIMYEQVLPGLITTFASAGYRDPYEGIYLVFGDYKKSKSSYQLSQKEQLNVAEIFGGNLDLKDKSVDRIQKSAFYELNSYLEME